MSLDEELIDPSAALRMLGDEELAVHAQNGDDIALDALFKRYRESVRRSAKKYFLIGGDHDDVVQEAMIGLFKAIRDFRLEHDVSFKTFAELCIRNQVFSAIKSATRFKHSLLNSSISLHAGSDDDDTSLEDRLASVRRDHDPVWSILDAEETRLIKNRLMELLSPLEGRVLSSLLQGHSYAQIAEELDIGVKSVDNASQRIRSKITRGSLTD